jgi:hypothetical protein
MEVEEVIVLDLHWRMKLYHALRLLLIDTLNVLQEAVRGLEHHSD